MNETSEVDDRHVVATYLSDMLALERHITAPIESQLGSTDHQHSGAITIIKKIQAISATHITALDAELEIAGGSPASGIKSAWASVVGGVAGIVNNARATKVSKSLRDDYTALNLAAISYTMLHATAAGLDDSATKTLAKKHLDDYTPLIVEISAAIPGVVLEELAAAGEHVSATAALETQEVTRSAWGPEHVGQ